MIFTKEQIKRLPGSTVRLAYGRGGYIAAQITEHKWFVEFQMRGGRMALANTNKSTVPTEIDIVEVLEWADEKQPEPEKEPDDATATIEQLHDCHARMVERLACEIYLQNLAKMKKAARLGVK